MRFKEAYGGWREDRLTQEEAALILGVSDRTFRRYIDRYEESVRVLPTSALPRHLTVVPRWMKLWRLLIFTATVIRAGMPGTSMTGTVTRAEAGAIHG